MEGTGAGEPTGGQGAYLPPVDMPVQTYRWDKRAVREPSDEPVAPLDPDAPGAASIVLPEPYADPPPVPPTVTPTWAAPPPTPVAPLIRVTAEATHVGVTLAAAVALVMPLGLTFAVEGLGWHHGSGVNTVLIAVIAIVVLVGSVLIGLLGSELGRHRSTIRGLAAAGLAAVTTGLLAVLIDAHPGKFGFDLGPSFVVAVVGPMVAFAVAAFGRSSA